MTMRASLTLFLLCLSPPLTVHGVQLRALHETEDASATSASGQTGLPGLSRLSGQPTVQLQGGVGGPMPMLGFGTCCRKSANGPALIASLAHYFQSGGRLVDTAQMYDNHLAVGTALRASQLPREEVWITSKVAPMHYVRSAAEPGILLDSLRADLHDLGTTYLDLYLLHLPRGGPQMVESFKVLLQAQAQGLVHNVGVSNFNQAEVEALHAATGHWPAVNQLEYHPFAPTDMHQLVKWCQSKGIQVTAYESLGGGGVKHLTDYAPLAALSTRLHATPAQVLLSWALQQGVAVIAGASSKEHVEENMKTADFHMTSQDVDSLTLHHLGTGTDNKIDTSNSDKMDKNGKGKSGKAPHGWRTMPANVHLKSSEGSGGLFGGLR